ncbi:MAG: GWxTD domain-containing protein [Saprospiraceae bacterium]
MIQRLFLLFLFLVIFGAKSDAQEASVTYATFKTPTQNYVEFYLHVVGKTIAFQPVVADDSTQLQANVQFVLIIKKGDKIIKADKFNLNSPIVAKPKDFVDLKRYALPDGEYELEVQLTDNQSDAKEKTFNIPFKIDYQPTGIQQSDIQLLASFERAEAGGLLVKNGVYMEPLPFNFYGKRAKALYFYNEIYGTDKLSDDYLVSYSVERRVNGGAQSVLIGHKRKSPAAVTPVLLKMDITELPSGNYNLVVEVRDRTKATLSKKSIYFQRSNPYLELNELTASEVDVTQEFVQLLDADELAYSLRAITPLTSQRDIEVLNLLLKEENLAARRMYLFNFWAQRSPNDPKNGYDQYMEVARAVDNTFNSGFRHGFETDRGFTYLKYGRPADKITVTDEPTAPPYEIWTYYDFPFTGQSNVKFLFYNPALDEASYILLHSTARNEINNPQWERELYKRAFDDVQGSDYFGGTDVADGVYRRARELFNDF